MVNSILISSFIKCWTQVLYYILYLKSVNPRCGMQTLR